MTALIRAEVTAPVPGASLWRYVTDWPRQAEWVPLTRVERVDGPTGVGGRLRAWTGIGPVGFWDPLTITGWEVTGGGDHFAARCDVLHTGRVVRGEAGFTVDSLDARTSRLCWWERVNAPALLTGPGSLALSAALRRMARLAATET